MNPVDWTLQRYENKKNILPCILCIDDTDEDPCNPNPCLNGGTCSNDGDSYSCKCAEGFIGKICEESEYNRVWKIIS